VATYILEAKVFELIREVMLDPRQLRRCFKSTVMTEGADLQKTRRQLTGIATRIDEIGNERRRMIELYASDQIARDAYINANIALDTELDDLKRRKSEIAEVLPHSGLEEVDEAVRTFCERTGTRLQRCSDVDAKRQFLVDHIEKIIYHRDSVTLIGSVPIELKQARLIAGSTLPFRIEGQIDRAMVRRLPKGQRKLTASPGTGL
jgi:hypothetical protein